VCEGDRGGKTMDLGFVREVVGRKRAIKVEEDGVVNREKQIDGNNRSCFT